MVVQPPVSEMDPLSIDSAVDLDTILLETTFVRDILWWLERTRVQRTWRVISAPSGSGKTQASRHFANLHPVVRTDGETSAPVLTIVTPHERARGGVRIRERLAGALGAVVDRRTQSDATWVAKRMYAAGVELVILDDAHKLVFDEHLPALKEISDLYVQASGGPRFGIAFVSATRRGESLLRSVLEGGDSEEYGQYVGRSAAEERYVALHGLAETDTAEALAGFEQVLRGGALPDLHLARHAGDIHRYLRLPALAPTGDGYALMRELRHFVDGLIERLIDRGLPDIDRSGALIEEVGSSMVRAGREVSGNGRAEHEPDRVELAVAR